MSNQIWPIDMSVLIQTAGSKADKMLPDLIPIYLEDGDLLVDWMAEALQIGNALKLHQAAHRLKGNSASLGVLTVAALADQLEGLGKTGDLPNAVQPFNALAEEYKKVKSALLDMISS